MAIYVDKRTGNLFVQFNYQKQTFKQHLPSGSTRKDAQKLETKMRSDAFFQANDLAPRHEILFEDFLLNTYLPYVKANNTLANFQKADYICLQSLPFFKGKSLRAIKPADIEAFKSHRANTLTMHGRPRMPATIARELSIVSKLFSLAVANDLCDYNPCGRVSKPKFDNVQNKVLSYADEAAFFAKFDKWQGQWASDICKIVLNTGLRQNDVLSLTRFDVDLAAGVIRRIQGKTKRRVEIPINSTVHEILARRMEKRTDIIFPSPKNKGVAKSIRSALDGACERAKIDRITIRDLRRTFATRLQENGTDSVTVARMLGHSDLRMVGRYARSTETMRNAVNSLENTSKSTPDIIAAKIRIVK